MKATIREIAERVGVSSASVSLVLNHRDCRISEETRQKIFDTAREIGYGEVTPIKVGGWSDASIIAGEGVPVVYRVRADSLPWYEMAYQDFLSRLQLPSGDLQKGFAEDIAELGDRQHMVLLVQRQNRHAAGVVRHLS